MTIRRLSLKEMLARQDNARGMGLARDVRAGQAKPVPTRAQKDAINRERERLRARYEWSQGQRRA